MESPLTPQALAQTYAHPSYADPWDAVEDYQRVQEYAAKHPQAGRHKVGTALELPPSRVRGWLDGGKPDCVRGVHQASDRGWFEADFDSDIFASFNELVAAIYSGGSINERYVPLFTDDAVTDALDTLGVKWGREDRGDGRAAEIVAREPGSVLGRALSVLDAPVGEKRQVTSLPRYLDAAPKAVREQFITVYLRNRGHQQHGRGIKLREDRPDVYLDALASFFRETLDAEVSRSEKNVYIAAADAAALAVE